jgi:hypothetical protein
MEVSGQLHALAALPWRKSPWYPLNRRLGGLQNQSRCSGEEKKILHSRESNTGHPAGSPSIYRLPNKLKYTVKTIFQITFYLLQIHSYLSLVKNTLFLP